MLIFNNRTAKTYESDAKPSDSMQLSLPQRPTLYHLFPFSPPGVSQVLGAQNACNPHESVRANIGV